MGVLKFDGADDELKWTTLAAALGNVSDGAWTCAVLMKRNNISSLDTFSMLTSASGTSAEAAVGLDSANKIYLDISGVSDPLSTTVFTNLTAPYFFVVSKGAGTVTPRLGWKSGAGGSWTHENMSLTLADQVASTQLFISDFQPCNGWIGIVAWWEGAMSDGNKEALTTNWRTSDLWNSAHGQPEFLAELNVAGASVVDLAGNASGLAVIGTTLDAAETLDGWTFDGATAVSTTALMPSTGRLQLEYHLWNLLRLETGDYLLNEVADNLALEQSDAPITLGTMAMSLVGVAPTVQITVGGPSDTALTPGVGALALTGAAPVTLATYSATPLTGALTLTPIAPRMDLAIRPLVGALTLAGAAPRMDLAIQPLVGALAATGVAPRMDRAIQPVAGSLTLAGVQASTRVDMRVEAPTGALVLTGIAVQIAGQIPDTPITPLVGSLVATGAVATVLAPTSITPTSGALTLTGFAPTALAASFVTPTVGTLTLAGATPRNDLSITPLVGTLTLAAAAVRMDLATQPTAGTLTLAGAQPTLRVPVQFTTAAGALTLTGFAPNTGGAINITPSVGTLTATGVAPTRRADASLVPLVGTLTATGVASSIQTTGHVVLRPTAGILSATGQAPIVDNPLGTVMITPTAGGIGLTGQAGTTTQMGGPPAGGAPGGRSPWVPSGRVAWSPSERPRPSPTGRPMHVPAGRH